MVATAKKSGCKSVEGVTMWASTTSPKCETFGMELGNESHDLYLLVLDSIRLSFLQAEATPYGHLLFRIVSCCALEWPVVHCFLSSSAKKLPTDPRRNPLNAV